MQSEYFIFDGIKSQDMEEMYLIRMESGLVTSPFFGGQDVEEEWVGNRITPYDYGTQLNPIEFTIQISPLDKEWTPQIRNAIGRWLVHRDYKLFQTADDLGKYYYARCIEAPNFQLASNRGYLELTFRTNSAYSWSPIYIESFDLIDNVKTTTIELDNLSNINQNYKPKVEIEMVGSTDVTLKNLSNGGKIFEFKDLFDGEIVSVDSENEEIVSSRVTSNPFAKFNGEWLELVYGRNAIQVSGKCRIRVKSQFPILQ